MHKVPFPGWTVFATKNLSPRKLPVRVIVLHSSGGSMQGGVAWLTNEASGVSADFMVSKAGVIVKLNPDMKSFYTWHAGKSKFGGRSDVNEISIGIEHEHFDGDEWPGAQVEASGKLCAWLVEEFGLDLSDGCITSHRAIALPRGRKSDPREFPWVLFSGIVRRWLDGI